MLLVMQNSLNGHLDITIPLNLKGVKNWIKLMLINILACTMKIIARPLLMPFWKKSRKHLKISS
jgi:hypothetical protein